MPVEELDMQKRRWHLPKERSKNNRAHVVPLSKTAYLLLKDTISSENGAIFKSVRVMTPLTSYAINQSLQRILKQADIPQATTHDLRRTAATLINSLGYPSELVARILNHSPKGVTDSVYALYDYESEKLQALESLAEHLISLGL